MSASQWKTKCEEEFCLYGLSLPDTVDWKCVYEAKPLGKNLLKNPSPHGLTKDNQPPEFGKPSKQGDEWHHHEGDFSGWTTSVEKITMSVCPPDGGNSCCMVPQYSWFNMEQTVDLKAEGFWDELLDECQPEIIIQDWYEKSRLHENIYELHVELLEADKRTVIAELSLKPNEGRDEEPRSWREVSHVLSGYGPGVRYILFRHRLKSMFFSTFRQTVFADSTVIVKTPRNQVQQQEQQRL